jgi:hypothetical protein
MGKSEPFSIPARSSFAAPAVDCELVHPDKITIATSGTKQRKMALFPLNRTYSLLSD